MVNGIKKKRLTMMISEQMDVSIINAIHFSLQSKFEPVKKNDPYVEYIQFLLLKMSKNNFEEIKNSFLKLPLDHLQDKIVQKCLELISDFSNEQVN